MVWEQNQIGNNTLHAFGEVVTLIIHGPSTIKSHNWDLERLASFPKLTQLEIRNRGLIYFANCSWSQWPGPQASGRCIRALTLEFPGFRGFSVTFKALGVQDWIFLYPRQLKEACSHFIPVHSTFAALGTMTLCSSPEEWNSSGDLTWYLMILLFLLFFSKVTF